MSKLKLIINFDRIRNFAEIQQCKKSFIRMDISNRICTSAYVLKSIQTIASISESVTALDLQCVDLTQTAFFNLMKQCLNLKKLSMYDVEIEKELEVAEPLKILLEELVVLDPTRNNLKVFSKMNLQSKKILIFCECRIGNFLSKQEKLESLGIETSSRKQKDVLLNDIATSMTNITSIKHLSLIFDTEFESYELGMNGINCINKFLELNKNSLKSLELETRSIPAETYQIMINHLKLEKLIIDTKNSPGAINCSVTNTHLKTLIVRRSLKKEQESIFKAFPAIEYLSIRESSENVSKKLFRNANNLKSVKYLKCPSIKYHDSKAVCLPSLRAISTSIDFGFQPDGISNLLTTNPTIETLVLNTFEDFVYDFECFDEITRYLTNLKRLFINDENFVDDKKLLQMPQMLTTNCKNLEIFQLHWPGHYIRRNNGPNHFGKMFFGYSDYHNVEKKLFNREDSIWGSCRWL